MPSPETRPPADWNRRWSHLARTVGLDPRAPVVLALSGGADSVLLLHLLVAARERPAVTAVHVDHGLRGLESDLDALFCARLARELGVPFVRRRIELEPGPPSLEARAREARYRVLARECRRVRCRTLITGHHADDGLETLLMRWTRGTDLTGLASLRARLELEIDGHPLRIARPLISMRRAEVRRLLTDADLTWREDSSNRSPAHTRNRVRNVLLPEVLRLAGRGGVENLHAFGRAVEELEANLAGATAYLAWSPIQAASACRSAAQAHLGGTLSRAPLMQLPSALRRRALWRLLLEGTGRAPRRALLERLLSDLRRGRCVRHALPRGWSLQMRSATLDLQPPRAALRAASERGRAQAHLPFPEPAGTHADRYLPFDVERAVALAVPGAVVLTDGRQITTERVLADPARELPRGRLEVELDLCPAEPLEVRWLRPGDRFHPLGAPGSRPLARILADCGVPRGERDRVPLVVRGEEIVWVAGLRPSETARVGPKTPARVVLRMHAAAPEPEASLLDTPQPLLAGEPAGGAAHAPGQRGLWDASSG
jgi:tRNA(Ile)-lysidine synthase